MASSKTLAWHKMQNLGHSPTKILLSFQMENLRLWLETNDSVFDLIGSKIPMHVIIIIRRSQILGLPYLLHPEPYIFCWETEKDLGRRMNIWDYLYFVYFTY